MKYIGNCSDSVLSIQEISMRQLELLIMRDLMSKTVFWNYGGQEMSTIPVHRTSPTVAVLTGY
jgi:hypothetical protein